MGATEFEVVVSDRTVSGSFAAIGAPPSELTESPLTLDPLAMSTVGLMERWLNFWRLISDSSIPHRQSLFERNTFEVVGRQLWRLILDNEVGKSLGAHLDQHQDPPLRLVLTFTNRADPTLRGLPWEFLFHPEHKFLASKTGLLLTRYVHLDQDQGRPTVTAVYNDQLRVLLLAALPAERKFAAEREDLERMRGQLEAMDELDVLEPIEAWDQDQVHDVMATPHRPCHIVHVLGICKGPPGRPRLFLGGEGDGFQDPQQLVEGLTAAATPQLVILQLCDYEDGDTSENFERLAPALVEKGVPAVLALQYAAPADEVGVGADFYRSLIDGKPVGVAVQASREALARSVDRNFATPVLYLGNDGALRKDSDGHLDPPTQHPLASAARRMTSSRDVDVKDLLADVIRDYTRLSTPQQQELLDWVAGLGLARDATSTARESIALKLGDGVDDATRTIFRQMLGRLGPGAGRQP